ncbi:MAG: hypothetical protein LBC12_04325 [Nitrososphaerota archaeon]|jgi:hypothetical protein|nr:hypothetical protein [Nitrososphaerota archaeon]
MSTYKELKKPLLTKKDEEYEMLIEVAEDHIKQKTDKDLEKSGTAVEVVIREHLICRGFNITLNPNQKLEGSEIKCSMFMLESITNPSQKEYPPNEVKMVIQILNNTDADSLNKIKTQFDELKKIGKYLQFAVVILSEKIGYTHEITTDKLCDKTYHAFTLVSRKVHPKTGGLYSITAVDEMLKKKELKKTGDWDAFIAAIKAA